MFPRNHVRTRYYWIRIKKKYNKVKGYLSMNKIE